MHLVYSALQTTPQQTNTGKPHADEHHKLRCQAYRETCNKYTREIAAIQKYLPGWIPAFPG